MNKKILQLAIPNIISNITVPLLGLVDLAIVGHLDSEQAIGAIAVGGMLFSIIYWLFGFLRMGTSGLTAQAYGKRDFNEIGSIFIQALATGLLIAFFLLALQIPIKDLAFYLLHASEGVEEMASTYFLIRIWGAPSVLALYGLKGWFIGMQNSRFPMYIAITVNVVNILCSLFFVYVLGMDIAGVALGTVIAQYIGLLVAVVLWFVYYGRFKKEIHIHTQLTIRKMERFFSINSYIFIRTVCLVAVTSFFTAQGAQEGDTLLAVNTLLMQLFTLFAYVIDGFAFAGEALTGRFIGARDKILLHKAIRSLFLWGFLLSAFYTLIYALLGEKLLHLLTNNALIIATSKDYFFWAIIIPLSGFVAFLWDGIYIGATAGKEMSWAAIIASIVFFILFYCLHPLLGNHALWLAFIIYLLLRGVTQTLWAKRAVYQKL